MMPDWVHRRTKALLESVPRNELKERESNYIMLSARTSPGQRFSPSLDAVRDGGNLHPDRYWVINPDDSIGLLSLADRTAIDDRIAADKLLEDRAIAKNAFDADLRWQAVIDYLSKVDASRTSAQIADELKAIVDTKTGTISGGA